MRKKLFTFLLALVTSVGLSWATVITWDASKVSSMAMNVSSGSDSRTSDGITVTAVSTGEFVVFGDHGGAIEIGNGEGSGGGYLTFTSTVGNIAQIDIKHSSAGEWRNANGDWISPYYINDNGGIFTWSGTPAASVTLTGDAPRYIYDITSIEFTIEDGGGSTPTGLQVTELQVPSSWADNPTKLSISDMPGFVAITKAEAQAWDAAPAGDVVLIFAFEGDDGATSLYFKNGVYQASQAHNITYEDLYAWYSLGEKIFYTGGGSTPATGLQVVEVTSDIYNGWNSNGNTFSVNALPGFQAVTFDEAKAWTEVPTSGTAVLVYRTNGDYARVIHFFDGTISGDYDLETDFNQMYENITLFGNRIFYTAGGSTPTPANVCGDGLTWELNGGVLTISYDGEGTGEMYDFGYEYDENPVNVAPWKENKSAITTVVIGDGVKSIGNYAFNDLGENFTAVTIANSVERIGVFAFTNAKWITEITLPSSLKTIDRQCFSANFGITSITIPSGVTSIGYHAFGYCTGLTSLTCEATTPPTLASGVFSKIRKTAASISSIPLYVPSGSVAAYEAAAQWNAFDVQAISGGSTSTSPVTAARFVYNYDCQRNPPYPQAGSPCNLSGFKDPYEGYKGSRNGNIALGPWKLEFVAYYTPSNNYDCASQVNSAVNQYYKGMSSEEKEAKKLEMPIFRLWQYNLTAREYQPATYGIVCAYAGEANAQDHAALFISSNDYGCFLSGHQHTTSFDLTCENDLTTGLNNLVTAASATDPDYDAYMPVIVSIDAIGPVELSEHCKYYIEGSRAAYDALTDEQKAQVTNYSTLTNAETQWAALAAAAQPYADAVIDLINAIPNPVVYTQDCQDKIDAAQAAYNALTDGQKILVSNYETLKNAPSDLIKAAPYVHILFKANGNEKKVENVTLPKEFTDAEMKAILKELYGVEGDYDMYAYDNSNADAVNISYEEWTIYPFMGEVNVHGNLEKWDPDYEWFEFSLKITLELPPLDPTPTPSGDKLPGVFSVSGTKAVNFSKGNLQYDSENQIWQFAANQWDYIGNAAGNTAITVDGIPDNSGIVDLFGWVGASSSWITGSTKQYGISTSTTNNDYGNVYGEALKQDWGNTMGSNWRTLTKDEWNYLLTERANAANLRTLATVNDKSGLILMPDGWTASGVSLTVTKENYTDNTIGSSDWATLAGQGCVFLPAAGSRNGNWIMSAGTKGHYWSSTSRSDGASLNSFKLVFMADDVDPTDYTNRYTGLSVRLVSETAPAPTPEEQVPTNVDPENPSYHYSTFFHSTQNYKLSNDGTQAFIADLSNNELVLTEIAHGEQVIPANTAVILRKTGSADPVVLIPTEENVVSVNPNDNSLEGVDAATLVTDITGLTVDNCYVLSGESHDKSVKGVGFYKIYGSELKQHKAYVKYAGSQNNAPKKMRFVYGQATSIEDVQGNNVQSTKVIENGVLYIIRDGKTYNAMGQMVK